MFINFQRYKEFYGQLIAYSANRKISSRVKLEASDLLIVEDEQSQQSSFVHKLNCAIRNLKSKIKGVNVTNLKVLSKMTKTLMSHNLHAYYFLKYHNGQSGVIEFKGSRVRNKYDFQVEIYKEKITVSFCNHKYFPCIRHGTLRTYSGEINLTSKHF